MSRMYPIQRKTSLRVFWVLIAVLVLILGSSSIVVAYADPIDHAESYGQDLSIKRNKVDVESESYVQSPLRHGEELQSTFTWVVPKGDPRPNPGDTMTVQLPEWLRPTQDYTDLKAGDYTTCSWTKAEKEVVCTFTDKVKSEKDKDKELSGHFVLDMIALENNGVGSIYWGKEETNVFDLVAGITSDKVEPPSEDTHLPVSPNDNARSGPISQSLHSFREVEYDGESYVRLQWVVDVPAENFDLAQSLTLHDKLQEVKSDAWGGWTVPQYLAPDMEIEILRRDGGALEHGVWDASEVGCAAALEQGSDCADLVATIRGNEVMERPGRIVEGIKVEGGIPEAEWHEKLPTEFKIKMSPLVKGAAYRIVFYTFVPSENLPEHGAEEKAIARNTLDLNGLTIDSDKQAEIFTQPKDGSGATATMGMFRIDNAVVGDTGKAENKEFRFDFDCEGTTGTLTANARKTSKESPKFKHGTTCVVTQDVDSVQMEGFKLDVGENPRTIVVEAGEVKALRFGSVYQAPPKSGTFAARSIIADPKPTGSVVPEEFTLRYECDKPSNDGSVQGAGELKVKGDGTIVESPEFLAGTKCTIQGSDEETAAIPDNNLVAHLDKTEIVVPVGSGAETPVSTVLLTNTYVPQVSKFRLSNQIEGTDALTDPLVYRYQCGIQRGELKVQPGEATESPDLPVGAECQVELDETSADVEGFDLVSEPEDRRKTITIGKAAEPFVPVDFHHAYAPEVGTFKIKNKVVTVGNKGKVPELFDFSYTCTKAGQPNIEGEIAGIADGHSTESEPIPAGYRCSVRSNDPRPVGSTLVTDIGSPVQIAKGNTPEVEVTHAYARGKGDLAITMKLEDPKASTVGGVYAFTYECKPPEDKPEAGPVAGTLGAIGAGESATSESIPEGSTCTVTQHDTGHPSGDLANSGYNSVLVLERNKNPQMQAVRKYDDWRGTLRINNVIAGSGANVPKVKDHEIRVSYSCVSNNVVVAEGVQALPLGETIEINDIHVGSECTVSEQADILDTDELRYEEAESTTEVVVAKITAKGGTSETMLRNVYTELGKVYVDTTIDGVASEIIDKDTTYTYQATWKEEGQEYYEEFHVHAGETYQDLPALPVGTPVTIKEVLPENSAIVHWGVPSYTSTPAEAFNNHGDGNVTLHVQPRETHKEGVKLTVNNTANPPAWWLAVPVVPIVMGKPMEKPQKAETTSDAIVGVPDGSGLEGGDSGGAPEGGPGGAPEGDPQAGIQPAATVHTAKSPKHWVFPLVGIGLLVGMTLWWRRRS